MLTMYLHHVLSSETCSLVVNDMFHGGIDWNAFHVCMVDAIIMHHNTDVSQ